MADDYYAVLGVRPDASEEDIKRAYRRKARDLHPDANPDDPASEERFKQVTLAYETLRDPEKRRRYDMFGPEAVHGAGAGARFGDPFGMGDIFDAFFGGDVFGARRRGAGPARQPGPDASVEVEIPFEVVVFGGDLPINVELLVRCERCSGNGAEPGTSPVRCRRCQGSGQVQEMRRSLLGSIMMASTCPTCQGTGEEIDSGCRRCHGDGRSPEERTLTLNVRPGVTDGTQLHVRGRGHAGLRGAPPGDLFVHVRVMPHPELERVGNDLVARVRVGIAQAALGTTVTIPTTDGEEELAIPPGTQPGRVFTLRGGGVPYLNGRDRGDLRVVVDVEVPTRLSGEEDKLLRRLAELRHEEVAEHRGFFDRIKSAFT